MSGGLSHNFRQGNRSELLADYLMSSIALTTPIRRQDDLGYDFYCQLSNESSGYLTFGSPFLLQIKSDDGKNIVDYGVETNWKPENLTWLFKLDIPLFIGIVNKKKSLLEIYDTSALWQVYNLNHLSPSRIRMQPSTRRPDEMRENCRVSKLENWPEQHGDGMMYEIDLGNPLISLSNQEVLGGNSLTDKKNLLGRVVDYELTNILLRKAKVRAFTEIKRNEVNSSGFMTALDLKAEIQIIQTIFMHLFVRH